MSESAGGPLVAERPTRPAHSERGSLLVIDDDPHIRMLLSDVLGDAHRVFTARNGLEGLRRLRDGPRPCLILLDLMMPGLDGYAVLDAMRASPDLADTPVVVITAAGDRLAAGRRSNVVDVVGKPFSFARLEEVVDRHCLGHSPQN